MTTYTAYFKDAGLRFKRVFKAKHLTHATMIARGIAKARNWQLISLGRV